MTEKPETISESLRQMDVATIRLILLEMEAYLAEQTFSSILTVLKVGVGLGLDCNVLPPMGAPELRIKVTTAPDDPVGWKSIGKLITTTGSLMNKVGIDTHITTENLPKFVGASSAITIRAFPPSLSFLRDVDDSISAQDVLLYLDTPDDN